jgi:hypothetical protein
MLPELKITHPPMDEIMITVPRDGSAAVKLAGNRHNEANANDNGKRMEK